jgi:hypothetical protein
LSLATRMDSVHALGRCSSPREWLWTMSTSLQYRTRTVLGRPFSKGGNGHATLCKIWQSISCLLGCVIACVILLSFIFTHCAL